MPRHRIVGAVLLGVLLLGGAGLLPAQAQPDERCFEATGYCVSGRILAYWQQNGGLPVFGYPITPQRAEEIEGETLQVQWFERNRLELHPENDPPYDVLLGRLGVEVLEQRTIDWQSFPTDDAPQEGCRYFEASGQNVCGEILAAWRADGLDLDQDGLSGENEAENLALFGIPISQARTETLEDGNEYTVQWFERARFEIHPENPPEFRVLFGLLGREAMVAPENPPTAAPTVAPTVGITPTPNPAPEVTPTPSPTASAAPAGDSADVCTFPAHEPNAPEDPVQIVGVEKVEEVVTLRNVSSETLDLSGWTVCSVRGNERHEGIVGILEPGESADYTHQGTNNIWSNTEPDDAVLYDDEGTLISYWSDPAGGDE
jgi:hypothetical protein